ncbi:hypothetical protein PEDI_12120 [Persicobacter diffluens]|uniref:AB hydrolase-1 domain-containing protein n=2 Tax=Persicobacter diffluens TaxID=981 RepID=A0AAN4VXM3_9BACT|nr:hypothetical protein PEDI_12120 [Persicobacter diffluens]
MIYSSLFMKNYIGFFTICKKSSVRNVSSFIFNVLFIVISLIFTSCMKMRTSETKILKDFKGQLAQPVFGISSNREHPLHYMKIGNSPQNLLVFIHGAPGSLDAFLSYMKEEALSNRATLITLDREGYGFSGYGKAEPSIGKQAKGVKELIMDHGNYDRIFLVGHSYGGPIACKLAMDFPDLPIERLILLAPALDPAHEKVFWFNKPMDWTPFKWMLPGSFKVANLEKIHHRSELELMTNQWGSLRVPITVIHGKKDSLVPFENVAFLEEVYQGDWLEVISLENENHFIPWTQYDLVKEILMKYLPNP